MLENLKYIQGLYAYFFSNPSVFKQYLLRHELYRNREHNGGVFLRADGGQGLEVAQLERRWGLRDDVTCLDHGV